MESLLENPAFRIYALCSAILGVKMLASAVYTGTRRQKVGGFINPEDAKTFGAAGAEAGAAEAPEVAHALRIQRNDLENIPLFFAIGLIYMLTGASLVGAAVLWRTFHRGPRRSHHRLRAPDPASPRYLFRHWRIVHVGDDLPYRAQCTLMLSQKDNAGSK